MLLLLSMLFFCNILYADNVCRWQLRGNPKSEKTIFYNAVNADHTLTEEDIGLIDIREFNRMGSTTMSKRYSPTTGTLTKFVHIFDENNDLRVSRQYNIDGFVGKTIHHPLEVRRYVYDANGNLSGETIRAYDEKGRLVERRFSNNYRETFRYVGNITYSYMYNADGELRWFVSEERDNMGRVILELHYTTDGRIASTRQSEFDDRGNILWSRRWNMAGTLQEYRFFVYNRRGHLIESGFRDSNNSITTYRRDRRGNLLESFRVRCDNDTRRDTFTYNRAGLLIEWSFYDNGVLRRRTTYEYDAVGNWIKKTNFNEENRKTVTKREIQYYEHTTRNRRRPPRR